MVPKAFLKSTKQHNIFFFIIRELLHNDIRCNKVVQNWMMSLKIGLDFGAFSMAFYP